MLQTRLFSSHHSYIFSLQLLSTHSKHTIIVIDGDSSSGRLQRNSRILSIVDGETGCELLQVVLHHSVIVDVHCHRVSWIAASEGQRSTDN